jgi:aspartate/methionine/tyrosine aminotransferase
MRTRDFLLEQYFAKYEFNTKFTLCPSDCETWSLEELLSMADAEARRLYRDLRLSYTESRGLPQMLEEISRRHHGISHSHIVTGIPEELIFLFMQTFLQPGDRVICVSPAYQSLYEVSRSLGCRVDFWSLTEVGNVWRADTGKLKSMLTQTKTRLVVLNFPHNPTGCVPSIEEMEKIMEVCRKHGAVVFSDEIYRGTELSAPTLPSASNYPHAIVLGGLSKGPGLPGLRKGWLVSQDESLISRVLSYKDFTSICSPGPSEVLSLVALRNLPKLLDRSKNILRENLSVANAYFQERRDLFSWIPPQGGTTAFPKLKRGDVASVCKKLIAAAELLVLPDSVFELQSNRFRVGLGKADFPDALDVFKAHIDSVL